MIQRVSNFLDINTINYMLNLDEVKNAKQKLNTQNNVYFNIKLSSNIQQTIYDKFGLLLTQVPMIWIKSNVKPHIDVCNINFNNTYIVYISDCKGELLIEDNSYPIQQNIGYVFSEGLKHDEPLQCAIFLNNVVVTGTIVGDQNSSNVALNEILLQVLDSDINQQSSISPTGLSAKITLRNHTSYAPSGVLIDGHEGYILLKIIKTNIDKKDKILKIDINK